MTKKDFNIENEVIHFWIDHLEVYGTFKEDRELFEKLDFDNSNYWELDDYTFTKNEVQKFKYKIIFSKGNYSLFAYYKWIPRSKKQPVWTNDYITIYSTAFKLMEYDEIIYFLDFYLNLKHCRRFDICIDLKIDIDDLLKHFNNYETWREYKKSWKLETRYIWEVRNSLNKRQLIRIYDKLKDIVVKKKIKLYENYLIEKNITRVELEVRQELAKNLNYKQVFHDSTILWIFKNYLNKHTDLFDNMKAGQITLYRPAEKIDSETFQSLYYKIFRKKIFIWHARTIYDMWFCPIRILIWEWLISPKTEELLWSYLIQLIREKEIKLKEQARSNAYKRKDIEDLSSNYPKYD